MKFLILCADYPNLQGGSAMAYVHTRNKLYLSEGVEVDVINFSITDEYVIDGIRVHDIKWVTSDKIKQYDLVILHAPNLRNHYKFLKKHTQDIKKMVFFFHGHEVLKVSKVYSRPYPFVRKNSFKTFLQDIYDDFKFFIWRKYFKRNSKKISFIFVSNWMKDEFIRWIKPQKGVLENRSYITYNCVGATFEIEQFNTSSPKDFDFITIRGNLDNSKYAVDIVNNLAFNNPALKFILIGKGEFFKHNEKAPNLEWVNTTLSHAEMTKYLNRSRCALMPTRTDAQGVMMCEMSAFGMPVITSDIPVCHEVFDGVSGIGFIDNDDYKSLDIRDILTEIEPKAAKCSKYYNSIVGKQELLLLKSIAENKT